VRRGPPIGSGPERDPGPPTHDVPAPVRDRLGAVRGFVFDMDGTLVLADWHTRRVEPLPGALDLIRWLRQRDAPFVVFTNGTGLTPARYEKALRGAGFDLPSRAVMTPASVAVDVFLRRGHQRVVVLGNQGLIEPLEDAGIEAVPPNGRPSADAVLVGAFREFTMDALEAACHAVWGGALLYSCSQTVFFAGANGPVMGTSRAISAMVRSVTGCRVRVIGKPSLDALRSAGRRLGVRLPDLAVAGDDPDLEVPMAHRGRSLAIAVDTGIGSGTDSFAHLPEERRPHLMVHGVDELLDLCRSE
jgi:4-nitrophenyl phosphatase